MKMNFHQKNKFYSTRNNTNKNFFLPIISVIFFITFFSFSWTRNILFGISSPLWILKNNTISFFDKNISVLNSKIDLLKENAILKKQIKVKEKDYALFDLLRTENQDLKSILNRKEEDQKVLLGTVIVKPFLSPYDTLIIDVGMSNGVSVGNSVMAEGNVFIGYVSEVYDYTSKIILYSSPGEKINVLIGSNNIEKEAIGLGGGNFKVEIPREIDIKEGDSVVIPSISTNIFGVVEKIEFKESSAFQNILFKTPTNVSELKWVEVLLSNKK